MNLTKQKFLITHNFKSIKDSIDYLVEFCNNDLSKSFQLSVDNYSVYKSIKEKEYNELLLVKDLKQIYPNIYITVSDFLDVKIIY